MPVAGGPENGKMTQVPVQLRAACVAAIPLQKTRDCRASLMCHCVTYNICKFTESSMVPDQKRHLNSLVNHTCGFLFVVGTSVDYNQTTSLLVESYTSTPVHFHAYNNVRV